MSSHAISVTVYCLALAAAVELTVASRRPNSRIPTPARLLMSARSTYAGRVLVAIVWWWVGWHFFVR